MAGLTGGRVNHFNITKQAKDYDLEGHYVRTWLPELRNVPAGRIHEPWLMGKEEQARCGAVRLRSKQDIKVVIHSLSRRSNEAMSM